MSNEYQWVEESINFETPPISDYIVLRNSDSLTPDSTENTDTYYNPISLIPTENYLHSLLQNTFYKTFTQAIDQEHTNVMEYAYDLDIFYDMDKYLGNEENFSERAYSIYSLFNYTPPIEIVPYLNSPIYKEQALISIISGATGIGTISLTIELTGGLYIKDVPVNPLLNTSALVAGALYTAYSSDPAITAEWKIIPFITNKILFIRKTIGNITNISINFDSDNSGVIGSVEIESRDIDIEHRWIRDNLRTMFLQRKWAGSLKGYKYIFTSMYQAGAVYLRGIYDTSTFNIFTEKYFRLTDFFNPSGDNSFYKLMPSIPESSWPNSVNVTGISDYINATLIQLYKFDTGHLFDEEVSAGNYIKFDSGISVGNSGKGLIFDITCDELLYHDNSIGTTECIMDVPWLNYIDKMLTIIKRLTDATMVGSQISLVADPIGKYILDPLVQINNGTKYTHPNIKALFQTIEPHWSENQEISHVIIGTGSYQDKEFDTYLIEFTSACLNDTTITLTYPGTSENGREISHLIIVSGCLLGTPIFITLNNIQYTIPLIVGDNLSVANQIRTWAGWVGSGYTISGSGDTILFTKDVIESTTPAIFNGSFSGVTGTIYTNYRYEISIPLTTMQYTIELVLDEFIETINEYIPSNYDTFNLSKISSSACLLTKNDTSDLITIFDYLYSITYNPIDIQLLSSLDRKPIFVDDTMTYPQALPRTIHQEALRTAIGQYEVNDLAGYRVITPTIHPNTFSNKNLLGESIILNPTNLIGDVVQSVLSVPHPAITPGSCKFEVEIDIAEIENGKRIIVISEKFDNASLQFVPVVSYYREDSETGERILLSTEDTLSVTEEYFHDDGFSMDIDYFPSKESDLIRLDSLGVSSYGKQIYAIIDHEKGELYLKLKVNPLSIIASMAPYNGTSPIPASCNMKCTYSVNSIKQYSLANQLEIMSSIIAIQEIGVYNIQNNLVAYGTFPPIILDAKKYHTSFNLLLKM